MLYDENTVGLAKERFHRLPPRVSNALIRAGLWSWEQVAATPDATILALKRVGPMALHAIRQEQESLGL